MVATANSNSNNNNATTTATAEKRKTNTLNRSITTNSTNGNISHTMMSSSRVHGMGGSSSRGGGGGTRSRASGSRATGSQSRSSGYSANGKDDNTCLGGTASISAGRGLFVSCLIASAVCLGYLAHDIISTSEDNLARAHYDAIAERGLDTAVAITLRKTRGTKSMASIIQNAFPNASKDWPNVALDGYQEIARNLIETSNGRGMGFCPLVEPGEEAIRFEQFAYEYFDKQFGSNHTVGISSFGKGIYAQDPINNPSNATDNRFLDRDGRSWNATSGSYDAPSDDDKFRYLAPMIQIHSGASPVVMRNIRNDRGRGDSINRMMECVQNNLKQNADKDTDAAAAAAAEHDEDVHCGVISDHFIMSGDGTHPSAFIYEPIQPILTNKLTGFVVSSIRWSDALTNIFTDQVKGIDLVLSVGGGDHKDGNNHKECFTYTVHNGNVTLVGKGDLHQRQYDDFGRSISLTQKAFENDSYTLTLYPNNAMLDSYSTRNPVVAAVGVVLIVIFTSLLFFVYDCLVSRNIRKKGNLLDAKREFMRYVSHEVRTPLNTVVMGLTLLQEDVQKAFGGNKSGDGANCGTTTTTTKRHSVHHHCQHDMTDCSNRFHNNSGKSLRLQCNGNETDDTTKGSSTSSSWKSGSESQHQVNKEESAILQLSDEILSAATSAVGVLNDFLNYDKIENKSLTLDLSILNIWHDLQQAMLGFKLPAEAKEIDLTLDLSGLAAATAHSPNHHRLGAVEALDGSSDNDVEQGGGGSSPPTNVSQLPLSILEKRVVGDDARISQVFRNILSNSLKFTDKGGSITVQAFYIPLSLTQGKFLDKRPMSSGSSRGSPAATIRKMKGNQSSSSTATTLSLSNDKEVVGTPCGHIQISIQDNGAGMTEEQLGDVFAAGVQFNVNALQKGNGSGLGMYIAKEIVSQHGGTLVAESEGIGWGSTFTITLPLYDIPDEALPEGLQRLQVRPPDDNDDDVFPSNVEDPEMAATVKPFEPLRVLVVDDAATNRKLLRRLLERRGHVCDEAKDGSEAILKVLGNDAAAAANNGEEKEEKSDRDQQPYFDTILLDYEMPVCNGPDCVAKLREEGCDSFVVGITGNVLPEDISHFKACGANEVLHKPVDLDVLGALWMEYGITGSGGNTRM